MRVLYCTDTYPPQVNGVSTVTHLSVVGLAERGWHVGVVAPRYPAGPDVFGADRSHLLLELPSRAMPLYPEIRLAWPARARVLAAARDFRPDLVHCATEFAAGWLGWQVARTLGVPLVTSYHTDFSRYTRSWGVPFLEGVVQRGLTRFHRRAAATFTPSDATRRELVARGLSRAVTWGCGVDAATFRPEARTAEWRARLAPRGECVLLHVGRLAPEKNLVHLLTAFARCRRRLGDRVRLVIAGDGPSRTDLEARAGAGVAFLGFLDRAAELPALYASADAFVFSSLTETLGLVVLEAMASGLPVAAIPAGGVADHLRDGVNGLAADPADPADLGDRLVDLAADPARRRTLAAGALATARALGWDRELDRLDTLYRGILARGAAAEPTAPGTAQPVGSA
ncbi:MAG: glycosyltransferase family 4 protein [Gemmatimonadales bacterium]